MSAEHQIKDWKIEDFNFGFIDKSLSVTSENPAGQVDLTDEQLNDISGGTTVVACTFGEICQAIYFSIFAGR